MAAATWPNTVSSADIQGGKSTPVDTGATSNSGVSLLRVKEPAWSQLLQRHTGAAETSQRLNETTATDTEPGSMRTAHRVPAWLGGLPGAQAALAAAAAHQLLAAATAGNVPQLGDPSIPPTSAANSRDGSRTNTLSTEMADSTSTAKYSPSPSAESSSDGAPPAAVAPPRSSIKTALSQPASTFARISTMCAPVVHSTNELNEDGRQSAAVNGANLECVVCGDKSSGKHYGQFTCEGCKSFFKRSVRRNLNYSCRGSKNCPVDVHHRNQCQYCRLKKCIRMGMRREAVQRGRVPTSVHPYASALLLAQHAAFSHHHHQQQQQQHQPHGHHHHHQHAQHLSAGRHGAPQVNSTAAAHFVTVEHHHHHNLFAAMAAASAARHHQQQHEAQQQQERQQQQQQHSAVTHATGLVSQLVSAEPYPLTTGCNAAALGLDGVCELAARLLFAAVEWAKSVPIFGQMSLSDQVCLLRGSWSELFALNAAQAGLPVHATQLLAAATTAADGTDAGERLPVFMERVRALQTQLERLAALSVDAAEYACLKAIVLFSTDTTPNGLSESARSAAESAQERAQTALDEYCRSRHGATLGAARCGRLLLRLPALKALGAHAVEQLFFVRLVGKTPIDALVRDMLLAGHAQTQQLGQPAHAVEVKHARLEDSNIKSEPNDPDSPEAKTSKSSAQFTIAHIDKTTHGDVT